MKLPAAVLAQHIAVLGKTGSGKTSTAKLAIEQVCAEGARVCILDPIKSDWWGLTSSRDGKQAGLPFHILGGPRGHVPLHASAGKAIGEIVASGALPLSIIDMADFEPGGQQRFFVDFAPALLRKMKGVVYLVVEEAHLFAPKERSGWDKENLAIHWAKTLATAGRSKGIRLLLVTQRTQALHNALLGSCDTLIAHRLTAPADQKPVLDWLKANTTAGILEMVSAQLASLKTGAGWICSGEAKLFERRDFPRIHTYDNTATPEGDGHDRAVKTAAVDQDKLRSIIGDAVKEAEANDPKLMRRQIAELQKQLSVKRMPPDIQPKPDMEAVRSAEISGQLRGRDELMKHIRLIERQLKVLHTQLGKVLETEFNIALPPLEATLNARAFQKPAQVNRQAAPVLSSKPAGQSHKIMRPSHDSGDALPAGERKILTAIAQHPMGCTREQLTVLTGYKRSSRDTYLQRMRQKMLIVECGEFIEATAEGVMALGTDYEPLPTGDALRDHWMRELPEGERKILTVLSQAYPDSVDREILSERTGYQRSSRDTYIQRLSSRRLVVAEGRGLVKASEILFS